MPAWVVPGFLAGAATSLVASSHLARSLARLGQLFSLPELVLGLLLAAAADSPEVTSALSAMTGGQRTVGVGVLLGSNVFNIAVLLGLGPLVSGRTPLHRGVVVLEGVAAVAVAVPSCALVTGHLRPSLAGGVTLAFFGAYVAVTVLGHRHLPLPGAARRWLAGALDEEEAGIAGETLALGRAGNGFPPGPVAGQQGLGTAVGARPTGDVGASAQRAKGVGVTTATALAALVVVVGASAVMEKAATRGGPALGLSPIVVGAVVLAGVTSLPNAVAALYLARAGRGAALMSEAMNSNSINVAGGLAVPAVLGLLVVTRAGDAAWATVIAYLAMTTVVLVAAYIGRGLGRLSGTLLVLMYLAYVSLVVSY